MNDKKYLNLIINTKIADTSYIKGLMIIRPYGYKIWENIQKILNKMLIKNGYENVYFPLLIPKFLFKIKKRTIKNCAIVTHTKFNIKNKKLKIDKKSKLNEEYIIRPTSENIVWDKFTKWIKSYKDLPILINQWVNVVRFELRNKLFIRNSEFLWQEGHSAHKNKKKALIEIKKIKKIYKNLIKNFLSIPFISGYKTEKEKFVGAKSTYTFETISIEKGKSIQLATIHNLAKNYSKMYKTKFINNKGQKKYVWGTSWGISTRLIGAIIMIHNDNNGLILPPKIAPIQIIIIPIYNKKKYYQKKIKKLVKEIKKKLIKNKIRVKDDYDFNISPGEKFYKYDYMGVPIKIIIGKKEIKEKKIQITRRDLLKKFFLKLNNNLYKEILIILKKIQKNIYYIAKRKIKKKIYYINNYNEFKKKISKNGGLFICNWYKNKKNENIIQKETKASIRCILKNVNNNKKSLYSKEKSNCIVAFGKSY
ncbi:MAG: His/Gly/Thr/Pro-type tRNA ligase C-terminal domain-containing protein [Candidatus Shikimatogenerans bostrichidophilus]|nr:MAG: His/Gly/Thr/Pro-type tRNA ligase C-terminal domain-containing protein [Candidatus Shikimatogenerans bostrichidophilus]